MESLRKATLIMLIIEQHSSLSLPHIIRLIRVIRGFNSGRYELDLQFEKSSSDDLSKKV
jgi:hypothetical protein